MGNDKLIVGWMDSRKGSYDSDNQDIYVAKVDFAAGAAVPQANTDQTDPVALSVALSKRHYPGGGEGAMLSGFATRNATNVVIVNKTTRRPRLPLPCWRGRTTRPSCCHRQVA